MLGRRPRVVPMHSLQDGINAARLTIPLARFDAARCARGIDCLKSYQAEWDENLRTFKKTPLHDWASHGADAFRYLAMSWREVMPANEAAPDPIKELLRQNRSTTYGQCVPRSCVIAATNWTKTPTSST